ncbi:dihydropteroate synthase [Persicimonas caeni]|uniref:Dihydropteroate synthase n=1 Tax=Persicimonas caeni TaxID=2292766 RepID=A0A4Y6PNE3_PERCE|nr:dihydropteroate synthase [Persicimonas caeni]QDG49828.1 dihydropteroate synthase [Persicimonas caeni]QED31049.1 dihydropteroate synthase [Persicimonas caeni]
MSFYATPTSRPALPSVKVGDRTLAFGGRFYVMGVLNVTPDSFSDGGQFYAAEDAIARGVAMWEAGADIIDVGGESTRPGADPVPADEELARVVPVIEALAERTDAVLSIDTYKAAVARAACEAGAGIINDISGLGFDEGMAQAVADTGTALVLMHTRGTPKTMQKDIDYDDVVEDIRDYFAERLALARQAGIADDQVILDPGIGFGKTVEQNYRLIRDLHRFFDLGCPLLLGTSRKSFIGKVLDKPADERVWGTAATVACGLYAGADIVRVHDVAEMVDVVRITQAIAAD